MAVNSSNNAYYDPYNTDGQSTNETSVFNAVKLKNNAGIFGIPYQFLPSVDRRIGSDGAVGRKYGEKIMARGLPLLFLCPCKQEFMEGFNAEEQGSVINQLLSGGGIEGLLNRTGRYYTANLATGEYYNIVNRMSTIMTAYMGLQSQTVVDKSGSAVALANIDWGKMTNKAFNQHFNMFAAKRSPVFYVDGMTSISDSFSNSTMESSLASSINSYSDQAKEIRFLLGNDSALVAAADSVRESVVNGITSSGLEALTASLTNGMIGDLTTTGVTTVLTGGKMIFPKMWADSTFSRSYSFDIKLRSPDHDTLSIFMNIIAPYLHLLALVMPKSIAADNAARQSPNAYQSPFLVKAFAKGLFNINMGLITDMSVTRGAQCEWNVDGLPTQIDVSLTIEDLYSSLFMSDDGGIGFGNNWDLVTNTEFMDFLANLGGLNVATDISDRKSKLLKYLTTSGLARFPSAVYRYFENGVSNQIRKLWEVLN